MITEKQKTAINVLLKVLNEAVKRSAFEEEEIQKIQKIQDNIKNLKIETIDEELIKKVMLLQELVSEVTA